MMIFSLVVMIGLEKCCITSACLQWLCHSGERTVARGPLVIFQRKQILTFHANASSGDNLQNQVLTLHVNVSSTFLALVNSH